MKFLYSIVFFVATLLFAQHLYSASLPANHFEGGKNLTVGSKYGTGGTLVEVMNLKPSLGSANPAGDLSILGTIIAEKDNATSFRLKGLQHSSEGSASVQSYAGMFTHASYDTVGVLKTRATFGGNVEMDVAIQSPRGLLLIGQDGSQTDGVVKVLTQNAFEIHPQYAAEQVSPKRLLVNRVSTASKGTANTSDVTLSTNDGKLYLQHGHVGGGVVYKCYTDAERDALTPVPGEFICNSTTNLLNWYNGTAWRAISDAAI
jgi:hypothetical protein